MANSVDPDEMLHSAASHLDLHYLLRPVCPNTVNMLLILKQFYGIFDWPGGCGFEPAEVGNILSWRLIMNYFLRSFSPFRRFYKGSCQFLAKDSAKYWLTP